VSEETRTLRLEVKVPDEASPGYDAVIRSAAGQEVWRAKDLAPASYGQPLALDVPARVLVAADYRLSVTSEATREPGEPKPTPLEFSLRIVRQRQSP
jgi:hypothetical protein